MNGPLKVPIGPDDHVTGPADAPVTLVEYGDYECPHCGHAYHVLRDVLRGLGDDVRYVFRNFPLSESHPHAMMAAAAAESVAAHGGNDAFWAMHEILYENQDALEVDDLLDYAAAAGVDVNAVAEDLSRGTMNDRVRSDFSGGARSGVNGTPAFFVNGRRFDGDWTDAAALREALREAARAAQW